MADFVFGIIIVFMLALFLAGIVLVFWFILDVTDILKRIEAYRLSKQYQKEIASAIKSYKKGGKTMLRNLIFWFLSKEQKERHECREILAKAEFEFEQKRRILELDASLSKRSLDYLTKCVEDKEKYEHEYHNAMELKGIELAKLDAKIEYSKALVSQNENTIKRQQEEIDRLFKLLQESLGQKVQIVK